MSKSALIVKSTVYYLVGVVIGTSIDLLDTAAHIILDLKWHGGDLKYLPYQHIALSTSEYSN